MLMRPGEITASNTVIGRTNPGWFVIAHDIETNSTLPSKEGLLLSAFCLNGEDVLVIDNTSVDNSEIFKPEDLKRCLFVAHNADFEARWGVTTNFLPARYACTMVNDKRLLSGQEGYKFDLVSVLNRRLGHAAVPIWMDKDIRAEFATSTVRTDEQILYNAADTIRLVALLNEQLRIAEETEQLFLINSLNSRIIIPIARAEVLGIKHDSEAWVQIAKDRQVTVDELCEKLNKLVLDKYGVTPERVNPEVRKQKEAKIKRDAKWNIRKEKLLLQKLNLEEKGKTHLKSYQVTLGQLEKLSITTPEQTLEDHGTINWGSQPQVLEVFKLIGCPIPMAKDKKTRQLKAGVGKDARANWKVQNEGSPYCEVMDLFDKMKKIKHNITSFGEKWVEQYVRNGRAFTLLDQAGTDTGRFSSGDKGKVKKHPNMQQIPKFQNDDGRAIYRECFVADPGRKIITIDYKNCEGVIMIAQSGDLEMKKITELPDQHSYLGTKCWRNIYKHRYEQSKDPKWLELAQTYEMNKSTSEKAKERDKFKNSGGLFPVAYGVFASKVASAAGITESEGQIMIDTIKNEIPKVVTYLDGVAIKAIKDGYAQHNKRTGSRRWFQGILDEKHYGWKVAKGDRIAIESAARNTVIQGTNSDIVKEAIAVIEAWTRLFKVDMRFLLTVHDEIVIDAPEDKASEYAKKIQQIMQRTAQNYLIPEIQMGTSCEVAAHWSK